jgi:hypothetical protein
MILMLVGAPESYDYVRTGGLHEREIKEIHREAGEGRTPLVQKNCILENTQKQPYL